MGTVQYSILYGVDSLFDWKRIGSALKQRVNKYVPLLQGSIVGREEKDSTILLSRYLSRGAEEAHYDS
jgi:hypothetical protein